ncbi:MAG: hypothetical protein A2Z14_02565 [Chloroflexi bacterium RBG_16_48_8]|nr:MAG: hypothetical protein A2Z14_02565 [Chloroflexi bacterium RBG_16_48_8]
MKRFIGCMYACTAVLLTILACGPLSQPESCGDYGGVANEDLFNDVFESMGLFYATTGAPGEAGPEGEIRFDPNDELEITFESKTDVSIRACLEERKGGGKILFNETESFPAGVHSFTLGTYSKGGYVVRMILDETLVKNLPFRIE